MVEKILENVLYPALDEVESTAPYPERIVKSPEMVIYGEGGAFDSLSLVSFIVEVEEKVEDEFDVSVTLANEKAMSRKNSPFRTIQSLAEYVQELVEEANNAG